MRERNIDATRIKAASKTFGEGNRVEVCFFYDPQKRGHEFRMRWPEGRYVRPEIAVDFARVMGKALQHLGILQQRRALNSHFLPSDFDRVEMM